MRQLLFYVFLALGASFLFGESWLPSSLGIGPRGRIYLFFLSVAIGVLINFQAFRRAGRAAYKPGEAMEEVLRSFKKTERK